ncbi:MAG TPA: hypothetical protein VJ124_09070 [Pyrinomonadaceae bacterium]|nr:hypothetical protein [Pyrinomonadaceae bacterium]
MLSKVFRAEHVPWTRLFRWWDIRVYALCAVVGYLWALILFNVEVQAWLAGPGSVVLGVLASLFGAGGIAVVLYLFVRFLIGDPLLERQSQAARFFRGEFPSVRIARTLNLEEPKARQLWRDYYDTWQFRTSVHFDRYRATTAAGYHCRAVILLEWLFLILGSVGLVVVVWQRVSQPLASWLDAKLWLSVAYMLCGGFLLAWHRLPKDGGEPTGCWASWTRRNEENFETFHRELNGKTVEAFWSECRERLAQLKALAGQDRGRRNDESRTRR